MVCRERAPFIAEGAPVGAHRLSRSPTGGGCGTTSATPSREASPSTAVACAYSFPPLHGWSPVPARQLGMTYRTVKQFADAARPEDFLNRELLQDLPFQGEDGRCD